MSHFKSGSHPRRGPNTGLSSQELSRFPSQEYVYEDRYFNGYVEGSEGSNVVDNTGYSYATVDHVGVCQPPSIPVSNSSFIGHEQRSFANDHTLQRRFGNQIDEYNPQRSIPTGLYDANGSSSVTSFYGNTLVSAQLPDTWNGYIDQQHDSHGGAFWAGSNPNHHTQENHLTLLPTPCLPGRPFDHYNLDLHSIGNAATVSPMSSTGAGGARYPSSATDHESGTYYPIQTLESELLMGIPITSLAHDDYFNNIIYAATVSRAWTSNASNSFDTNQNRSRRGSSHQQAFRKGRTTLMVAYDTTNPCGSVYSSIKSHPEAEASTLKHIYESIFMYSSPRTSTRIPNHAYRPPYGNSDPNLLSNFSTGHATLGKDPSFNSTQGTNQFGVSYLLPTQSHSQTDSSNVISVSPAGVRVHSAGGLLLTDYAVEGMICGSNHPSNLGLTSDTNAAVVTHVTVGGIGKIPSTSPSNMNNLQTIYNVQCLDVWQNLRPVASYVLSRTSETSMSVDRATITSLGSSNTRGCIIAGCSDGSLRLLDGRGLREGGKMKSHVGGVVEIAVSDDGLLIATTGYGSRGSTLISPSAQCGRTFGGRNLHAFPDPSVLIYDIRYMGRGGIPHLFAGARGGPRHVSFIPSNVDWMYDHSVPSSTRLLVASGQKAGGIQIIVPFQDETAISKASFILPPVGHYESITSMSISEDNLALGTSLGNVFRYKLAGYEPPTQSPTLLSNLTLSRGSGPFSPSATRRTQSSSSSVSTLSRGASSRSSLLDKRTLKMPSFNPLAPLVSMDGSLLLRELQEAQSGPKDKRRSLFSSYILAAEPTVSLISDSINKSTTSFGPLAHEAMLSQIRLSVSSNLVTNKTTQKVDFLHTVPTSSLGVNLFEDHRTTPAKEGNKVFNVSETLPNPNKLIYTKKLFDLTYRENLNRAKRYGEGNGNQGVQRTNDSYDSSRHLIDIPWRYRVKLRPSHISASSFNHRDYNQSGLVPGWDYPSTMPNAFVSPIIMLLFFVPELRVPVMEAQMSRSSPNIHDTSLISELAYLFHRIETISKLAMVAPMENTMKGPSLEAWAPTSFISVLTTMPEAEQLQILDGLPAAVAAPRRPEAFYRFLMYHLGKQIRNGPTILVDSLGGVEFLSINQFVSGAGPESQTTTKQLTIELAYDTLLKGAIAKDYRPSFGKLLQCSLCRATELGAWNQVSKSYDTIVQRKILTSLPVILSLSPECAGCKPSEGLSLWHTDKGENDHWLPEMIEIEIEDNGSVIVRECVFDEKIGSEIWQESRNNECIPVLLSQAVEEISRKIGPQKRRYRLFAVVSMIRDDLDRNCPEEIRWGGGGAPFGHHVLHVRLTTENQKELISKQISELEKCLDRRFDQDVLSMTLLGKKFNKTIMSERCRQLKEQLALLENSTEDKARWILINGFVVSETVSEDARAFHVDFKEPSLIVFRAIDSDGVMTTTNSNNDKKSLDWTVPADLVQSMTLSCGSRSPHTSPQKPSKLPGLGDLVAFDAEFVSVQEEESVLTLSGSKVTIRETRHALARISVVDCQTRAIIFDDFIQPNEPVSDYLTRFSGIMPEDLNPKLTRHNLITSRAAYLKLRCLVERGCIFIGHGLQQDFWTANLAVPAYQLIDTLDIYHKPSQRFISLRFLTNFILNRDMQQNVHDSVEDAMAALELYIKAKELIEEGKFDTVLDKLYIFGQKTDWKLGVDEGVD